MNNRKIRCKVTATYLKYATCDGEGYEDYKQDYYYKYSVNQVVYYVYESFFGKYKIKQAEIYGIIFTNCPSYQLSNGMIALEIDLFGDIDEAVDYCEKMNNRKKYKLK